MWYYYLMDRTIIYNISSMDEGKNIHTYLSEHYYCTKIRTHLKHTENSVLLNGFPVFLNTTLHDGDILTIVFSEDSNSENIVPVDLPLKIVYEDEDILVVDKPADMPVHPAINNFDNTLANAIAFYFNKKDQNFVFRCINRLDRDTSGLLLIAKHRLSGAILSDFMKKRMIHREYHALAKGHFNEKSGTLDYPIGRVGSSIIERFVDFENGERAITHYTVLREYSSDDKYAEDCSLLSITLDTGRTHQIRVHMAYIRHPLLGDHMYNKEPGVLSRQALHSYKLEFIHPITLAKMSFTSEPAFS